MAILPESTTNLSHRIHGAGIYANMTGVYWWYMLPYIAYMDPMGMANKQF